MLNTSMAGAGDARGTSRRSAVAAARMPKTMRPQKAPAGTDRKLATSSAAPPTKRIWFQAITRRASPPPSPKSSGRLTSPPSASAINQHAITRAEGVASEPFAARPPATKSSAAQASTAQNSDAGL